MTSLQHAIQDAYWGNMTQLASVQLATGFTDTEAARFCCVSPHTYRRWRIDRPPNLGALRLLAIYAGYMPWPGWHQCQVINGKLYTQHGEKHGFTVNEIAGIDFLRQALKEIRKENLSLRSRLSRSVPAITSTALPQWS